jgi:hypothetical protein
LRSGTGHKKSEDSRVDIRKQTTFKVKVAKIEIGCCESGGEMAMCPKEPRLLFDAEEGFTVISKPEDDGFVQQVKETLTERQNKIPDHIKRVLIAQDPEEPKVYALVVQHEKRYLDHHADEDHQ